MKHCFIINPASGKETTKEGLEERILQTCEAQGVECFIYHTTSKGDAGRFIKEYWEENREEEIRFYACGGDGTLCEVVSGVMSLACRDNVSVGVLPVGTGNDFVRNFSPKELFFDIEAQIGAQNVSIDIMECNGYYAINMINIGFDSQVVVNTDKVKKKRFIPSKLAYICGLVITLIKKPGVKMNVAADDERETRKELLLSTFANGCFCGGGFYSNPHASLCDGRINALFVKNITRMKFITLVGKYTKGTHLDGGFENIIEEQYGKSFSFSLDTPTQMSVDGEIVDTGNRVDIRCLKKALRFLIPQGVSTTVIDAVESVGKETVTV